MGAEFRWLHITDLHVGRNDESQRTALGSLVKAIERFAEDVAFDFVLFSGDLAYSGRQVEYDELLETLIRPLRELAVCKHATFLATPGNHDLNCDVGFPPVWSGLGKTRQEKFFHIGSDGELVRRARAAAFTDYKSFISDARIWSVDPTVEPAKIEIFCGEKYRVAIIAAVTSFFSDKEVSDYVKAPAPVHPIRTLLQDVPEDVRIIVLGHHPRNWFTPETQRQLHSILVERNALYLHGHEHSVRCDFGVRGLASLGFGAAYQAPMDGVAVPHYRNSFAICEIGDLIHIRVVSWDTENGVWRYDQNLPGDFADASDRLPGGYQFSLPTTRLATRATIVSAARAEYFVERCVWIAQNEPKRWVELLSLVGLLRSAADPYAVATQRHAAGHAEFRVKDERGQFLVHAVSGHGDILNVEQLQILNTELDRQDYEGCIVVTLGDLASDARALATQLGSRKAIRVFDRSEFVGQLVRNLPPALERKLARLDPTGAALSLVITDSGFAVLVQDRIGGGWFSAIEEDGTFATESSSLVQKLRSEFPRLGSMQYKDDSAHFPSVADQELNSRAAFDRADYLAKTYSHFDDVKYAALSALGLNFRKTSLSEMYVQASAAVGGPSKQSSAMTRAVSELVESLNLPKVYGEQLESQLRSRYGLSRSAEDGVATQLYQRYNNVVVLGDPGSGKTCFLKHEILAYCMPVKDQDDWYAHHLPIYVSLAEASRLLGTQTDLLAICEIVAARRGVALPRSEIEESISQGRAAFFFDGLDEVGFIDRRITLISQIGKLVGAYAARGNRFVLASRPAAVQPVDIPDGLTYLQLKGLTDDEIRILAGRVLTSRLGDEIGALTDDEQELVDRLVEHTRQSVGIARIARNPLLLTLLVLIYANSGAFSARRHIIYTQAIRTLVSVRGRETKDQHLSEADLRTRLGALALCIFRREIAEIPRRSEVIKVLAPLLAPASTLPTTMSTPDAVNSFVQEVAEATGLLTIHADDENRSDDLITFMHYSFLEYYAAAGLLTEGTDVSLKKIAGNTRWRDVITLFFGILSDQRDVTPYLRHVMSESTPAEKISKYRTLLALDCAAECDVPPEASQRLLAAEVFDTIATGAGRFSSELRSDLAGRLDYFLQGAGPGLEGALVQGLQDIRPTTAAAFADLIARLDENVVLSPQLVEAFRFCLNHTNSVVRTAVLLAIERRPELRVAETASIVDRCLDGSVAVKHAALKVVSAVPAYYAASKQKIRLLLSDGNSLISETAAQCILAASAGSEALLCDENLLEQVLASLNTSDEDTGLTLRGLTLDRDTVERLTTSSQPNEAELALRYVPLVRGDDRFVHQLLMQHLRISTLARHRAACLDSMRACPGALALITIADTELICQQLHAPDRNVRIAATRLLGEMPDDEQVVRALSSQLGSLPEQRASLSEAFEAAKALALHVRKDQRRASEVLTSLTNRLSSTIDGGFGDQTHQQGLIGLLAVCEIIGGATDESAARRLFDLAEDFRTPQDIRRYAIRAFGSIAEPTADNMDRLIELLRKNDSLLNASIYAATASFVAQCKRKVEYVRRVYSKLAELMYHLCTAWDRETGLQKESIDSIVLQHIRQVVVEVRNLMVAYEEFAERVTL